MSIRLKDLKRKLDVHSALISYLILAVLLTVYEAVQRAGYFCFVDDAFISFRIAKNLWYGNGFVFHPAEQIQTNTSVFGPLLQAPFFLFDNDWAVKGIRLFDVLVRGAFIFSAAVFIKRVFVQNNASAFRLRVIDIFIVVFMVWFYAVSPPMFGMETQIYILAIVMSFALYAFGNIRASIIVSSLALFARPEGLLVVSAIILYGLWVDRKRTFNLTNLLIAGCIIGAYFIFIFLYYGSIVPQSVIVKSVFRRDPLLSFNHYGEIFFHFGSYSYRSLSYLLPFFLWGLVYLIRKRSVGTPALFWFLIVSGAMVFSGGFLINVYPWYLPPLSIGYGMIAFMGLINLYQTIERRLKKTVLRPLVAFAFLSIIFYFSIPNIKSTKNGLVNGHKTGMIMRESAIKIKNILNSDSTSISLEPLGFIGFYNFNNRFKDFPGLASKEASSLLVQLSKDNKNDLFGLFIQNIGTDALILRPNEYKSMEKKGYLNRRNVIDIVRVYNKEIYFVLK